MKYFDRAVSLACDVGAMVGAYEFYGKRRSPQPGSHSISTVINFCSNDYRYIGRCIDAVTPFSEKIIVPYADHLFNGEPDDLWLIDRAARENPQAKFKNFKWFPNKPQRFWHNYARMIGSVGCTSDHILFLDSDEVVDTGMMLDFLNAGRHDGYDCLEFACYFYFREECFRANALERAGLLCRNTPQIVSGENIFKIRGKLGEREFIYLAGDRRRRPVFGPGRTPMVHHYGWARTKEEMLKKVRSWGHHADRDWEALVHKEFEREFTARDRDFIHNYTYHRCLD